MFVSSLFEYSQTENMNEWQTGSLLTSASVKKSDSVGKEQAAKSVKTFALRISSRAEYSI